MESESKTHDDTKFMKKSYVLLSLIIIIIAGLILRFYYFPYELPIIGDGLDYFSYAYKMSEIGEFPKNWALPNNGWPSFVSIIFSLIDSDSFSQNIMIQRIISASISSITAIPIFLVCNRFFNRNYSLIGAAIFVFEPRIIMNSTLGLIEPIYIMVFSIFLFFFLSKNKNSIYISFILIGILSLLRWEGLLLIFGVIGLFVIRNRNNKKEFLKLLLGIGLFLAVILPICFINVVNTGNDGLITPLITFGPNYIVDYQYDEYIENTDNRIFQLIKNGLGNTAKFFGLIMIPIFIIFLPFSIFRIMKKDLRKKWSSEKTDILIYSIIVFLPILYAFSRNFEDIRYLYILFPIFCIISLVSIKEILEVKRQKKIFSALIIIAILVISIISIESFLKYDQDLERERYEISKFLIDNASGVNLSSHTKYFKAAQIDKDWPMIMPPDESGHIILDIKKFSFDEFSTVVDFILENEKNGLTHLTAEDMPDSQIFTDVYYKSENYPFLDKIYDSKENQFKSKVKIFKINYEIFYQFLDY